MNGLQQASLFDVASQPDLCVENPDYMKEQIITYIGNKRSLLDFIGKGLEEVEKRLGKKKLGIADVFADSSIISRYQIFL